MTLPLACGHTTDTPPDDHPVWADPGVPLVCPACTAKYKDTFYRQLALCAQNALYHKIESGS